MPSSPLGITFMPSADAAAAGPRQASIEGGPGGSDLAAAFKILSLHLPRVLGASAIAPKRLLTSQGSAGVQGGSNTYSAVFQSLLQSMNAGAVPGGAGMPAGLSSLFGESGAADGSVFGDQLPGATPAPKFVVGDTAGHDVYGGSDTSVNAGNSYIPGNDTQYI